MKDYKKGFLPYGLAAFLIGIVGGFSTVLGPAFVQDLGISYNNTTWTALAQAMSTAACAPILGKIGDVIGRKTTLLLGIAVFTLGNVLSAVADSLFIMLAARFIVGIGTAAMSPVILAYITTEFPPDRVAKGFSLYMLISSASVIFGPSLGSHLISGYGWRAMLWLCVGISIAVLFFCLHTAKKEVKSNRSLEKFDIPGAVLVTIFFSLLLCLPALGQNIGWRSTVFWVIFAVAAVSLLGLISAERRAVQPILPGGLMRRRSFILSVLALFLTQGLMQANMTNIIVFVRYTQPQNTALSGYAISVMYLGMSLGAVILGPLADRFSPKWVLTGSLGLTFLGCAALFLFSEVTAPLLLMGALGILGLGLGGNGTIFMKVVLAGVSAQQAGVGSGTYGLFRDLSAPFGVAVFVPMYTNQITGLLSTGIAEAEAAVRSIHSLAAVELLCVIGGMVAVFFLPNTLQQKGEIL